MRMYKQDCFKKRPIALTALSTHFFKLGKVNLTQPEGEEEGEKSSGPRSTGPGAGMAPDEIEPFARVLKDGFYEVDCIKDYMFQHGDAFGANKHEYKLKDFSNVSIVHYKSIVPSEDQKEMTQEVCFEFCRTVPDMGFFGLIHGRDCYCAPYFKMMAGDSSQCDAVCEGKPTTMCGGMTKSSVFTMHFCADTAEDLENIANKGIDLSAKMEEAGQEGLDKADQLQAFSTNLEEEFGTGGDPVASDLCQSGKVFAGDLQHAAEDTMKISAKLGELKEKAVELGGKDMADQEVITEAEALIKELDKTLAEGEKSLETTLEMIDLVDGGLSSDEGEGEGDAKEEEPKKGEKDELDQYMSVMYFVDREYVDVPSTCGS